MTPMFTLDNVRASDLCEEGYQTLTNGLTQKRGEFPPMSTELTLGDIATLNGREDAISCLDILSRKERVATLMPVVKRVAKFSTDKRVHSTIDALDKWLAGDKTVDIKAVWDDAEDAVYEALVAADKAAGEDAVLRHIPAAYCKACYAASAVTNIAALAVGSDHDTDSTFAVADDGAFAAHDTAAERKLQLDDIIQIHPPLHN